MEIPVLTWQPGNTNNTPHTSMVCAIIFSKVLSHLFIYLFTVSLFLIPVVWMNKLRFTESVQLFKVMQHLNKVETRIQTRENREGQQQQACPQTEILGNRMAWSKDSRIQLRAWDWSPCVSGPRTSQECQAQGALPVCQNSRGWWARLSTLVGAHRC